MPATGCRSAGALPQTVDEAFVKALPKAELHAHLSGSVSMKTLHGMWSRKRASGRCLKLLDPLQAMLSIAESVDIISFFPLFDQYIYQLLDDIESVQEATRSVIRDFATDGVKYLELRTTPREHAQTGMTKASYVHAVHEVIQTHNNSYDVVCEQSHDIKVYLILSIDRKMTLEQANEVLDLAMTLRTGCVVGIDLSGNPARGDVETFTPVFRRAKTEGLHITVHFAEVLASATQRELEVILSWEPDRLGHVICTSEDVERTIKERRTGLELCLSCNVLAKMTEGSIADHHFRKWRMTSCPIALSTDDVGIFQSPLSNEYLLAAQHFELGPQDLVALSKSAASIAFGDSQSLRASLKTFETYFQAQGYGC
ncbi:hypothetical protein LTR78_004811 [Recurvomyces mirabilis]|uniref:Adenosine deaminase domain-containing protein n=1 Tax=Recurvomyces mirabilis TaxID=574656 RepID=A0AAE0WPA5_9PEZI|nr:hypothetical protein LTR78_004811 [Recurvomyces mirabilis]KAK5157982.1 hypothetical protein LTS14_003905 [Recurvomyces mirabilis]